LCCCCNYAEVNGNRRHCMSCWCVHIGDVAPSPDPRAAGDVPLSRDTRAAVSKPAPGDIAAFADSCAEFSKPTA
jgi:hypothetical protein